MWQVKCLSPLRHASTPMNATSVSLLGADVKLPRELVDIRLPLLPLQSMLSVAFLPRRALCRVAADDSIPVLLRVLSSCKPALVIVPDTMLEGDLGKYEIVVVHRRVETETMPSEKNACDIAIARCLPDSHVVRQLSLLTPGAVLITSALQASQVVFKLVDVQLTHSGSKGIVELVNLAALHNLGMLMV